VKLSEALAAFSKLKVIVAGDAMVDSYLWGAVDRISPEAPVPVVAISKKEDRLGGAANVALNLKELGAVPLLCSVIGKDHSGKLLLQALKKNKIRTDGILLSTNRITTVKTRVLSKSHQLIRYDSETDEDLNHEDERNLIHAIKSLITKEKPHAIIFEDYNKGVLTPTVISEAIKFCREKKMLVAVDPKKKNFFAYKSADIFKPNLREIRESFGRDLQPLTQQTLDELHTDLRKKLHHSTSIITLSENGIYFSNGRQSGIIPAQKKEVSDVSGAGDTVIATVVLALAAGLPLHQAVNLANIAGGLVCQFAGVVPITLEMLQDEIMNNKTDLA
jgi:rfaE bifunctional protein kinase chain/domain